MPPTEKCPLWGQQERLGMQRRAEVAMVSALAMAHFRKLLHHEEQWRREMGPAEQREEVAVAMASGEAKNPKKGGICHT